PAFYGEITDEEGSRRLLIERVRGHELHEFGDIEVWEGVAQWLAKFQKLFNGKPLRALAPSLIRYDRSYLSIWPARAEITHRRMVSTPKRRRLEQILEHYGRVLDGLMELPTALVHGELYSSNVLIEQSSDRRRVCVVDWETAGVGPALLDLAALTAGSWDESQKRRMAAAYFTATPPGTWASLDEILADLDLCQLHLAVQWLGWGSEWNPPARNDCDWLEVAIRTADQLHL
ncbi:MAG TPA: phosphotransferase, partial [Acidimicrobiales bacterium]|nr:phosphotransferase [Acidimicrobiales bacterium]